MRLQLSSLQSDDYWMNVEVPDSCTLQQLQDTVSALDPPPVPPRPSSSPVTFNLFLQPISVKISAAPVPLMTSYSPPSSVSASLKSLGVNSGDDILFSPQSPPPEEKYGWYELSCIKQAWRTDGLKDDHLNEHHEPNYLSHKLLLVAIHAVFLESGFVLCDPVSGIRINRFRVPKKWPSVVAFPVAYTLPALLVNNVAKSFVVVRFQSIGNNHILGFIRLGGHLLRIDANRFSRSMNFGSVPGCDRDRSLLRNIAEFWRTVKDGLVLPLFGDLRKRNSDVLLPSLWELPYDHMLKLDRLRTENDAEAERAEDEDEDGDGDGDGTPTPTNPSYTT